jgi:hypothetical protein
MSADGFATSWVSAVYISLGWRRKRLINERLNVTASTRPRRNAPRKRLATPLKQSTRRKRFEPQRYRWFDDGLRADGENLKALIENTLRFLEHHERHTKARSRARRPADLAHHLARVEAIVCNLAYAVLQPPQNGRLAIKLGNGRKGRSRYDSPVYGKPLSPLISTLGEIDILRVYAPSVPRREVSSIEPTEWFARKVCECGVQLSDFGRDNTEEVILLNRSFREIIPGGSQAGERVKHKEPVDYHDTAQTRLYRDAMRRQNAFLKSASIDFINDGLEPVIDPFDRTMRRHFVILKDQETRFDQSGRLYGGFWQNLKSARRQHIRIDGEPIVVLDYGSMFTRLAYLEAGATPPEGDLYAIPGCEGYRSGVKLVMNCFLFDGGTRSKWPAELGVGVGNDRDAESDPEGKAASFEARLPESWTVRKARAAILAVHPALKAAWGRHLGYKLMHMESEIQAAVLEALFAKNIQALGMHDGIFIAASNAEEARVVMIDKAVEIVGGHIPVNVK